MYRRNVSQRTIQRRLHLSVAQYWAAIQRLLKDGIAEDRVEQIRASERVHLECIAEKAMQIAETAGKNSDKIAAMALAKEVTVTKLKMFGANKPEQIEVKHTQTTEIILDVIDTREQAEQLHLAGPGPVSILDLPREQ
jgi:hypothetical protein